MQSISEVKKLDSYLSDFLYSKLCNDGFVKLSEICNKILNFEYVKGLDEYSKELLALSLEKRIMISIEKQRQKSNRQSYWEQFKPTIPYTNKNNAHLKQYIGLVIRDLKEPLPKYDVYNEIRNFYDNEIYNASKLVGNRVFNLPSGQKASINDLIIAINNTINKQDEKKQYTIKNIRGKMKGGTALVGLVTVMSIAAIGNKKTKVNVDSDIKIEKEIENFKYQENNNSQVVYLDIKTEQVVEVPQTINIETEFIGYNCECPIELQKYIYDISQKYNIPFNAFMTILDNESDGYFNTNSVKSTTNDYGFAQINECNLKKIEEHFSYSKDDILNDPYKNIEAAAWLLNGVCQKYEKEVSIGNYENIIGAYNGWLNWKQKEISIEYAKKGMKKLNEIYNKTDEQLYKEIVNYVNGDENETKKRI